MDSVKIELKNNIRLFKMPILIKHFLNGKNKHKKSLHIEKTQTPLSHLSSIYFHDEFIQFYKTHDYIYSTLQDLNELKELGGMMSDCIFDETEILDKEKELPYFIDLFYLNEGYRFVHKVLLSTECYHKDQCFILMHLYKKWNINLREIIEDFLLSADSKITDSDMERLVSTLDFIERLEKREKLKELRYY